jgi:serine/threonine protein kinase
VLSNPNVKRLFDAVCDLPAAERARVLANADDGVREAVLELLALDTEASSSFHSDRGARRVDQASGPRVNPAKISSFRVVRRLGSGPMGVVYEAEAEAEQPHPKRRVALKLLHPHIRRPSVVELFRLEAQALAKVTHPGVPTIYETGETDDGDVYLAMEWVEGPTLSEWTRQHRISRQNRVEVMAQIAEAVAAAHAVGVRHCGLKPSNIVITHSGPKILDFGMATPLAQVAGQRQLGTPAYMSPEALAEEAVDDRTDVFALACIAHELMTGALPDRSYSTIAMSRLSGDMSDVLQRGLAVDRDKRCPSAQAFAEDLRRAHAGLPLSWKRGVTYRFKRFSGRNKRIITIATALTVAALTLALVPSAIRHIQENGRRERAVENLPRLERALSGVDANDQRRAFLMVRTFAQDPSNRGTPAESAAWLLLATRLESLDLGGVRDALAEAYLAAEDPTASQIALGRHFAATASWDSLWVLRQNLDANTRTALADELHRTAVAKRLFVEATRHSPDALLREFGHGQELGIYADEAVLADLDQDGELDIIAIDQDGLHAMHVGSTEPFWSASSIHTTAWTTAHNLLFHQGQFWFANGNQHSAELYAVQLDSDPPLRRVGQFSPSNIRAMVSTSQNNSPELLLARSYPTRTLTQVDLQTGDSTTAISGIDRLDSDVMDAVAADLDGDGQDELLVAMGAWVSYDLRVYTSTSDGWTLHSRIATGALDRIVVIPRPGQSPLILASKNDREPNLRVFPPEHPYGPDPGVYAWSWTSQGLQPESFWPLPLPDVTDSALRIEAPQLGDFDGDGALDIAWTLKQPQVEEWLWVQADILGHPKDYVIAGLGGLGAHDMDNDGDDELLVSDESGSLWVLGSGTGVLPPLTRHQNPAHAIGPAPSDTAPVQRLWSRADDLVRTGLIAEAAKALVLAPELSNDVHTVRAAHAAAAVLLEAAGQPIDAAANYARAVELGDEASRDGLIRTRLFIMDLPGATEHRIPGSSPAWLADIATPPELDLLRPDLAGWQLARPGTLRLRDNAIEVDLMNDEGVIARMPVTVTNPWVQLDLHALINSLELGSGLALSLEQEGEMQLMVGFWGQGGGGVLRLHQQCGHDQLQHLDYPIISLDKPNDVLLRAARSGMSHKTRCFNSHNDSQQWREFPTEGIPLGPAELVLRAHGDANYSPPTRARVRLKQLRATGLVMRQADLVEQSESVRQLFEGTLIGSPHPSVAVEWALASADTQAFRRALQAASRQEQRWHLRRHGAAAVPVLQDLYPDSFAQLYMEALHESCSDLEQSDVQEALLRPALDTLNPATQAGRYLRVRRAEVLLLRGQRATARSIARSVTQAGNTDDETVDAWLVLARLDAARQDLARAHIEQAIALTDNGQSVWNRIARYPEFQDNPITPVR